MSDFTNSPQSEQEKYLNMMPDYGVPPVEDFRVGFGRRFGAAILDFVLFMIIFLFGMQFFGIMDMVQSFDWTTMSSDPTAFSISVEQLTSKMTPLSLAIGLVYYSMEIFFAATPGKIILGIKIGTADRHHADFTKLLSRFAVKNVGYVFTALFLLTSMQIFSTINSIAGFVILIGFFFTLSASKQALHDKIAGTAVYFKDEFIESNEVAPV